MNAINIETMLLSWSETANGGAKIVLQLSNSDDLEHFRRMTIAKGKRAGQRLAAAFVEVGDDERPVEHKRAGAGPLAQLAGRWCEDERFITWAAEHDAERWERCLDRDYENRALPECAAEWVRQVCLVKSRRELDTNPNAGRSFHKLIREPFHAWLQQQEGR